VLLSAVCTRPFLICHAALPRRRGEQARRRAEEARR
jgi:hypothetical protein